MKKLVVLLMLVFLTGCGTNSLSQDVASDKFDEITELKQFNIETYIESIDSIISSDGYIRLDSIFLEEETQETVVLTDQVIENILDVYNEYENNHSTYEIINFFDLHVKKLSPLDIDIIIHKIVNKVESDYLIYLQLINQPEFKYITKDYNNRLTTTYLDNYLITTEALYLYPNIEFYIINLNRIINGGYQIRKFGSEYYIFPDYASFLVRYDDYYSEQTNDVVDVLVSNSRNVVSTDDAILMDNEEIAYQIDQIEDYLKKYPNSVYYDMLKLMYQDYFRTLITNPSNIEVLTSRVTKYQYNVVTDFRKIVDRYSNTQLSRLLNQLVESIDENAAQYDQTFIDELIIKIMASY